MFKVINHLIKAVCDAAVYNPEIQIAPAHILWPDHDRQWEAVIPVLHTELPEPIILDFTQHCKQFQHRSFIWLIWNGLHSNIQPIPTVPDVGKKGAECLRDKPNINWNKGRGKDVKSVPWYHVFNGDRINDHHLNLVEKRTAREVKESSS